MPILREGIDPLRCFTFHGAEVSSITGSQSRGDCAFCGGEQKFHVNRESGEWDCKSCARSGNPLTFLRQLHEIGSTDGLEELAAERGLLDVDTLVSWGVVRSPITDEILVPGYNIEGEIHSLYRWVRWTDSEVAPQKRLYPTPGVHEEGYAHGLFGVPLFDPNKSTVHLCEGCWDGMAWWEVVGDEFNVLAIPGAGTFRQLWERLLTGKDVVLLFDNDHPREITVPNGSKRIVQGAGIAGTRRTATMLLSLPEEQQPTSISYLDWSLVKQ
jgi:hypothetical protein